MQTLNKRDKNLLLVLGVFLVAVLVFVMMPSGKGSTNRNQLPLEDAIAKNRKVKLDYKQMVEDENRLQPRVEQMTSNVPAEQLSAAATQDLYAIAEKAGVHIREIKPLRARTLKSGSLARVPLEVRFRAPFQPNVMRFLYYAEDPTNKMVVDKINITSTDKKLKSVDVAAQITIYTRALAGASATGEGESSDTPDRSNRG